MFPPEKGWTSKMLASKTYGCTVYFIIIHYPCAQMMGSSYLTYQSHWHLSLQITIKIAQIPEMLMKKHSSNRLNGMLSCCYFPRNWWLLAFLKGSFFTPNLGDDCSSTSCCCSSCSWKRNGCHEIHDRITLNNSPTNWKKTHESTIFTHGCFGPVMT